VKRILKVTAITLAGGLMLGAGSTGFGLKGALPMQSAHATSLLDVGVGIQWPDQTFAPYVDVTRGIEYPLDQKIKELGTKYFTLAFIIADENGNPSWTGSSTTGKLDSYSINTAIKRARALGGDVRISFGGVSGTELALRSSSTADLQAKYKQVIDAYDVTQVDFDIEGGAISDTASIERRSQAIANLQKDYKQQGKNLKVWLTLPVMPEGLTVQGRGVVASAVKNGIDVAGVNIMAMNYGSSYLGNMGDYAIQAMTSTQNQIKQVYTENNLTVTDGDAWGKIGVTPMIGVNDVQAEVFYPDDATKVLNFAKQKGVTYIGAWSLNRDDHPGSGPLYDYTGIQTEKNAFSRIFVSFSGGGSNSGTGDTQPPTAPTGVASTSTTSNSVTLKWNASTDNIGVQRYEVYRDNIKVGETSSLAYTDSNLQPATLYTYIIKAVDAAGNTTSSPSFTIKTVDASTSNYPAWSASKAYNAGEIVSYKGINYRAKWWSHNFPPDTEVENSWDTPWEQYKSN